MTLNELTAAFQKFFKGPPRIYRAPGRVNLIGEHTDYNEGFVMPAAINFSTWVAATKRDDSIVKIHSDIFNEEAEIDLARDATQGRKHWSNYALGVAIKLKEAGHNISGANLLVHGQV